MDHFSSSATEAPEYWSQRYYVDESQWSGEPVVFIYIGGEGPQGPVSSSLFMYEEAKKYGAVMIALEHRFYGESRPVENMTNENLKLLTSEQALADLARFIDWFSANYEEFFAKRPKWITFGGSYPGALSAWFKEKYPALAVGAIASSAPVFAVFDFYQYAQVTGFALKDEVVGGSQRCYDLVSEGVYDLVSLIETGVDTNLLPEALRPCEGADIFNNDLDRSTYYSSIYGNVQGTVQYNLEGSSPVVSDICDAVLKGGINGGLEALASATAIFEPRLDMCVPSRFKEDYVDAYLTNVNFTEAGCDLSCSSDRQWIYQSCNEFGYFQAAPSAENVEASGITSPFDAFSKTLNQNTAGTAICEAAFNITNYQGPQSDAFGLSANSQYAARNYLASNVTFVNGNVDPWHSLSIVNDTDLFYQAGGNQQIIGPRVNYVEIIGTAHCRDMYAPDLFSRQGIDDTESVKWAHKQIAHDIARYLKE